MKKTIITLMMATLFTVSGFAVQVRAAGETSATTTTADTVTTYKDEAGITPDSILYPVDKLIDEVQVVLSFTDASKVEALLDNAEERLGESEVMAEAGNQIATEEALEAYNDTVSKVNDTLDELVEANQDSEDADKDEAIAKLEEAVAEQQENSTEVLKGMKDAVSGDTEEILARVIEMQTAKKADVRAMVDARHELNDARKEYNTAKVELNKTEKSGTEEAKTTAQKALEAAETALNTEKVEYSTAFKAKQETVKKYAGAKAVTTKDDQANTATEATTQTSTQATEIAAPVTADKAVLTETASDKVKEEKKSVPVEKVEEKKVEASNANSQVKEKTEKAAEVQNSGKGSNKK
jgi:hypothetical protein